MDQTVDWAAAEIKVAVDRMLAELPADVDLNMVTTELIIVLGSCHPQMKKITMEMMAAREALLELGITL